MKLFGKRCDICKSKLGKNQTLAEVRIGTAEGVFDYAVCPKCAYILDKSAEVLLKGKNDGSTDPECDGIEIGSDPTE
jgi:hypothetical protein